MLLTDEELRRLRKTLEAEGDFNEELLRRCGDLIHVGAFDEAVRSAFVLLEERLRTALREEAMTGTALANKAFNATDGRLSKLLGKNQSEREGLRELFSGAFKLFRNPTAHGAVGYSTADGKEILGMVNLMLRIVKRAEDMPPEDIFPPNVKAALSLIEEGIGAGAANRLDAFLMRCLMAGMEPSKSGKQWIPFRKRALVQFENWDQPKPHRVAVFYLVATDSAIGLQFPTEYYYSKVVGFEVDDLVDHLLDLRFHLRGKDQEPRIDLRLENSEGFFEELGELVMDTAVELDLTLRRE